MNILKITLAAIFAAASLTAAAAGAEEDKSPKALCENEAKAEGLTETNDIKAYVYTCLANAEEDAAATKAAAEKPSAN